jgi:hypothetical protein
MDEAHCARWLKELESQAPVGVWYTPSEIRSTTAWPDIAAMGPVERMALMVFLTKKLAIEAANLRKSSLHELNWNADEKRAWCVARAAVVEGLMTKAVLPLSALDRLAAALLLAPEHADYTGHLKHVVIDQAELRPDVVQQSEAVERVLRLRVKALRELGREERELARVLTLLGESVPTLDTGEVWADKAIAEVATLEQPRQQEWHQLLALCRAGGASATNKFFKSVNPHITAIGRPAFVAAMQAWLPLVDRPRPELRPAQHQWDHPHDMEISPAHVEILKAFAWIIGHLGEASLARTLGLLTLSAYKKIPGKGPRAIKLGSACIAALGNIPGQDSLAQLAMLKVKVKFIPAQKAIDKALNAAAAREGLPREEIEELAVPSYGLTDVGLLEEPMSDFTARLSIRGVGDTELVFVRKDGKLVKSVPAAVKASHAEELKDLKLAMKDIASMLPAQKDRIDAMFLDDKSWAFGVWRERYLDHPLIGVLARKLIWSICDSPQEKNAPWRSVTWLEGSLVNARGEAVAINAASAVVRMWHPIGSTQDEVLEWRRFFEDRQIKQPFKQAHREVYLLTDAERRTSTYSNRYAAHVIKQHQFHALAALRGWRNKLRLLVDAEYEPPLRKLDGWGLRAEYWVEGAGEEWGSDTNEAGAYLYLVTDQVRFYRVNALQASAHAGGGGYVTQRRGATAQGVDPAVDEPLLLETIPPLVFSEIMRDVDLFVGVCSVANNPNWQDGGPENRYRDYWWQYGFGDLSGSAQSRRDLLSRLVPRLKIAGVCDLGDKFLTVRGKLRTYKIHLGSGNILMEPNDQYLCIVPSSRDEQHSGGIALPFEGDRVLSIILSKAFMLAADDKITDASIVSQIRR